MTKEAPSASSEKPSLAQNIWKGMQWTASKVSGAAVGTVGGLVQAYGGGEVFPVLADLRSDSYSDPNAVKSYAFIFPAEKKERSDDDSELLSNNGMFTPLNTPARDICKSSGPSSPGPSSEG